MSSAQNIQRGHGHRGQFTAPDSAAPIVRSTALLPLDVDGRRIPARIVSFNGLSHPDHVALLFDGPDNDPPWVRLHSACLTGDALGSLRCDCGAQLSASLAWLADRGGVLLYLQQEGRGIGLRAKVDAYALQDSGLGTFEANRHLGLPADARDYGDASRMLEALGMTRVQLLSANPCKTRSLLDAGIAVDRSVALDMPPHDDNRDYLADKRIWFDSTTHAERTA